MKQAVLSLSGGMDSSTLLLRLLAEGYEVTALSFDYGQKHKIELERATELVDYINDKFGLAKPGHFITHQIIKLDGLAQLLNSNLVEGGKEVPEGHYEEDNMKDTVVPNRNKIFSSIIQAVALSKTVVDLGDGMQEHRDVKIALGIHAGDLTIYPDCSQGFRDADYKAFKLGNWNAEQVEYYTPYLNIMKGDILKEGVELCKSLGLDFDEVYKRTITSYKPIKHGDRWYSDYKSASSVERIEGFINLGRPDPAPYANKKNPVKWETAKEHVEEVLKNWDADKSRD